MSEPQSQQRKHPAVAIADTLVWIGAMMSFIVAVSLTTCCCQIRKSDGSVHVLGNCDTTDLQDTCKGILDPDHQTMVEKLYEGDPKKDEDPDKLYLSVELQPEEPK